MNLIRPGVLASLRAHGEVWTLTVYPGGENPESNPMATTDSVLGSCDETGAQPDRETCTAKEAKKTGKAHEPPGG